MNPDSNLPSLILKPASEAAQEPAVAIDLYWLMPGPRAFLDAVVASLQDHRWTCVRVPAIAVPGITTAIEAALQRAHFDNERASWIKLHDGMTVASEIGTACAHIPLSPEQFANATTSVTTVILEPTTESAAHHCQQYLEALASIPNETPRRTGQPRLLVLLPEPRDAPGSPTSRSAQEIVFSGALTPTAMQAYVAVRMAHRTGPGSTGLFRALVTEFAGFDPHFAEQLMVLSDDALLDLPASLAPFLVRSEARWRGGRWSAGCHAEIEGRHYRHALHEMYLSSHAGPQKSDASAWLRRRYWRACVHSLMPWLEERRARVIGVLRPTLERHVSASGGKAIRTTASGQTIAVDLDDLEYNQIPGMIHNEGLRIPNQPALKLAVDVCFLAKKVRDSIAHLRPPEIRTVVDLTCAVEGLLGE